MLHVDIGGMTYAFENLYSIENLLIAFLLITEEDQKIWAPILGSPLRINQFTMYIET